MGARVQAAFGIVRTTRGVRFLSCIDQLKTAEAAGIEMGILFLREVDLIICESKDAQGMNVTSCYRKIVTITHPSIFFELSSSLLASSLVNQRFRLRKNIAK